MERAISTIPIPKNIKGIHTKTNASHCIRSIKKISNTTDVTDTTLIIIFLLSICRWWTTRLITLSNTSVALSADISSLGSLSDCIISNTLTSNTSANGFMVLISGKPNPRSHRETALSVTLIFSASSACVHPFSFLIVAINSPNFLLSILSSSFSVIRFYYISSFYQPMNRRVPQKSHKYALFQINI